MTTAATHAASWIANPTSIDDDDEDGVFSAAAAAVVAVASAASTSTLPVSLLLPSSSSPPQSERSTREGVGGGENDTAEVLALKIEEGIPLSQNPTLLLPPLRSVDVVPVAVVASSSS